MRFDLLSLSKPFRALFFTIAVSLIGSSLLAADNELTAQEKTDGWQLLFDGRTLDGWQTNNQKPSLRPVDEGCLNPHKCGGYMLIHEKVWGDCVLSSMAISIPLKPTSLPGRGVSGKVRRNSPLLHFGLILKSSDNT